jgi:16S rRNA G966 N2-methylase RsmD
VEVKVTDKIVAVANESRLKEIAGELRQLHQSIWNVKLDNAIRVGELLTQAKLLTKGEFLFWLASHVKCISERTARNYLNLFKKREQIKSAKIADLSVAYELLAHDPEKAAKLEAKKAAYAVNRAAAVLGKIVKADALDWLPNQDSCDLLLTDPPYMTDVEDFEAFAGAWLPMGLAKLKANGRAYIFIGAYPLELLTYLKICLPAQVLVWTYQNTIGPSATINYNLNWQAILYYCGPEAAPLLCPELMERWAVQAINAPDGRQGNRIHQWQKPDEIARRFIMHSTKPGDLVLDPFAGSGTFIHAAAALGRRALGCDIAL